MDEMRHAWGDGRLRLNCGNLVLSNVAAGGRCHSDLGGLALAHLRGRRGAPVKVLATKEGDKFSEPLAAVAMLRQEVGRVLLTEHLLNLMSAASDGLLHPRRVGIDMSQFAKALP